MAKYFFCQWRLLYVKNDDGWDRTNTERDLIIHLLFVFGFFQCEGEHVRQLDGQERCVRAHL